MKFVVSIILMCVVTRSVVIAVISSDFIPMSYDLYITTRLEVFDGTFYGTVNIVMSCKKETDTIVLNAVDLDIRTENVALYDLTDGRTAGNKIKVTDVTLDQGLMNVKAFKNLVVGNKYNLSTPFKGILADKPKGFFKISYVHNGGKRLLAATNFKPTYARSAFPCFDEAGLKAPLALYLIYNDPFTSFGNMRRLRLFEGPLPSTDFDNIDVYEETPMIAPHSVGFVISSNMATFELFCCDNGFWIKMSCGIDKADQLNFALTLAVKVSEYYYGIIKKKLIPNKVDIVAIPGYTDIPIQNFGLVICRETDLLIDEDRATKSEKQVVTNMIWDVIGNQFIKNG